MRLKSQQPVTFRCAPEFQGTRLTVPATISEWGNPVIITFYIKYANKEPEKNAEVPMAIKALPFVSSTVRQNIIYYTFAWLVYPHPSLPPIFFSRPLRNLFSFFFSFFFYRIHCMCDFTYTSAELERSRRHCYRGE